MSLINIATAFEHPDLFGSYIKGSTWGNWKVFLKSVYGLPLTDEEFGVFQKFTSRTQRPERKLEAVYCASGRKSGKTLMAAVLACYAAALEDFWNPYIKPRQKVYFPIIACDKVQSRELFNYTLGLLNSSKILRKGVKKEREWDVELKNGAVIMIRTANFKLIRGPHYIGAALDEAAFLRDAETAANPASEIIKGLLPGLIPGGCIAIISSVYNRAGFFYDAYRQLWGQDDPNSLFWLSSTKDMNPTFDQDKIERAMRDDPVHARAEYYSVFRDDISNFVPLSIIESCVIPGRHELPKVTGVQYVGFIDPSGGRNDSFCLCIAHRGGEKVVVDVLREKHSPFRPEDVSAQFSEILKSYDIYEIGSDRYGGEWVTDAFRRHGITVKPSDLSASELFLNLLPVLQNGAIELLDAPRLINQLASLERKTRPAGNDLITHPAAAGCHDDIVNALAGAVAASTIRHREPRHIIWLEDEPALPPLPLTPPPPWIQALCTTENVIAFAALLKADYIIIDAARKMGLRLEDVQTWRRSCECWIAEKEVELADEIYRRAEQYKEERYNRT